MAKGGGAGKPAWAGLGHISFVGYTGSIFFCVSFVFTYKYFYQSHVGGLRMGHRKRELRQEARSIRLEDEILLPLEDT